MQTQTNLSSQSVVTPRPSLATTEIAVVTKKVKVAPEVVQLNRVNLKSRILDQEGKFISVTYAKLDGETRILTGRMSLRSYMNGGTNKVVSDERPYITMFDIQLRQYLTVNLSTVSEIRGAGKRYVVVG